MIDVLDEGLAVVPWQVAGAGQTAVRRFVEVFAANIRNRNTRAAYARAVSDFFLFHWCEGGGLTKLDVLKPVHVAAYIEQLGKTYSAPSVKQHLAAVQMLFGSSPWEWLFRTLHGLRSKENAPA